MFPKLCAVLIFLFLFLSRKKDKKQSLKDLEISICILHNKFNLQTIYCLFGTFFVYLNNILSIMTKYSVNKVPSDILILIAQNVVALRKEQGWTQQDLAEKSDVSYGSIKRFERTGQISFESLLKIVESLRRLSEFENVLLPPKENQRIKELFKIY